MSGETVGPGVPAAFLKGYGQSLDAGSDGLGAGGWPELIMTVHFCLHVIVGS